MTKQIAVPASISRADYTAMFRQYGFDPGNTLSLKFTGKGIYAKVFERDENGERVLVRDDKNAGDDTPDIWECVVNTVFVPVYPYGT